MYRDYNKKERIKLYLKKEILTSFLGLLGIPTEGYASYVFSKPNAGDHPVYGVEDRLCKGWGI